MCRRVIQVCRAESKKAVQKTDASSGESLDLVERRENVSKESRELYGRVDREKKR